MRYILILMILMAGIVSAETTWKPITYGYLNNYYCMNGSDCSYGNLTVQNLFASYLVNTSVINATTIVGLNDTYLKLDASNDPITGNLDIGSDGAGHNFSLYSEYTDWGDTYRKCYWDQSIGELNCQLADIVLGQGSSLASGVSSRIIFRGTEESTIKECSTDGICIDGDSGLYLTGGSGKIGLNDDSLVDASKHIEFRHSDNYIHSPNLDTIDIQTDVSDDDTGYFNLWADNIYIDGSDGGGFTSVDIVGELSITDDVDISGSLRADGGLTGATLRDIPGDGTYINYTYFKGEAEMPTGNYFYWDSDSGYNIYTGSDDGSAFDIYGNADLNDNRLYFDTSFIYENTDGQFRFSGDNNDVVIAMCTQGESSCRQVFQLIDNNIFELHTVYGASASSYLFANSANGENRNLTIWGDIDPTIALDPEGIAIYMQDWYANFQPTNPEVRGMIVKSSLNVTGDLNVTGNIHATGCICYDNGATCLGTCI